MAKSNQLALHTPMPPTRVLGGHAEDKLPDCCCGGGTATAAARGVVPLPGNQPAVPGQDRGGSDRKDLGQRRRGSNRDKAASHTRSAGV